MINCRKGLKIKSLVEFIFYVADPVYLQVHDRRPPLFFVGRIPRALTWGFLQHWTFATIQRGINLGGLWVAEKIEEEDHAKN